MYVNLFLLSQKFEFTYKLSCHLLHSLAHILYCATNDKFIVASGKMELFALLPQDEFRQWFRAKVHVMLAPGKKPFDSLDLQSTAQLPNGDGDQCISAAHEDHHEKFSHRQHTQVLFFIMCCSSEAYSRFFFPDSRNLRLESGSAIGWFIGKARCLISSFPSASPLLDPLLHPPQH